MVAAAGRRGSRIEFGSRVMAYLSAMASWLGFGSVDYRLIESACRGSSARPPAAPDALDHADLPHPPAPARP